MRKGAERIAPFDFWLRASFYLWTNLCVRRVRRWHWIPVAKGYFCDPDARRRGDRLSPARTAVFRSRPKMARPLFSRTLDCLEWWFCTRTGRPPVAPTGGLPCDRAAARDCVRARKESRLLIFGSGHRFICSVPCVRRKVGQQGSSSNRARQPPSRLAPGIHLFARLIRRWILLRMNPLRHYVCRIVTCTSFTNGKT